MPSRPDPRPTGKGLERALSIGMDLVRQARELSRSGHPQSREQALAAQHEAAVARYQGEVRRHEGRVAGYRAGAVAGGVGAAVMGVATAASLGAGAPAATGVLAALAAAGAGLGLFWRRRGNDLAEHPPVAMIPPPPPARMRPGARGADQAERVASALMHLYDLIPNVGGLYPQAGAELWRAVSDVEPLLRGQVERLSSLDRIEVEMPGSTAARAAAQAGAVVTGRLREGADALDELIAASVRMLAAPDIGDAVPDTLAPAIMSLAAFAHGLNAADAARSDRQG